MTYNILINNYSYYQILNKALIKNKGFHLIFTLLDTLITIIKILDIYQANYNIYSEKSIKYLKISALFTNCLTLFKLLPIIIYLALGYFIFLFYFFSSINKSVKKIDIILINFFEFFLVRLLFIFFCEFLFSLSSLYLMLFIILTIPLFTFILLDINYFHITGFILKMIVFPYDDFTSLCDKQKLYLKIFIAISGVASSFNISKLMFLIQLLMSVFYLLYDTYIIFYKSYYIMNNELISKNKYANLLSLVFVQILMFFMKPDEIFQKTFIIILCCIIIFSIIFVFLFYNPYNYIRIDIPENKENIYYYFFLLDRNKIIAFFLEEKIKKHVFKCNYCALCKSYQALMNEGNDDNSNDNERAKITGYDKKLSINKLKNKEKDLFYILYSGQDKSMELYNHIINNIKKLGVGCLYNNTYYIINLIFIFYYSARLGNITFSLNQLLLFNLIQENNQAVILNHKISINQILYVNEFLNSYKQILSKIKEIISTNNIKPDFDKFFELSKKLNYLNNNKFKENLYYSKNEGMINYSYMMTTCSLLYEEIFNKTLSSYSIPLRENTQLHEDLLKNFYKQNNSINLKFNLKTSDCRIIYAGKELFYSINTNFYDLFPNLIKQYLIQYFYDIILNSKITKSSKKYIKTLKQNKTQYIEPTLLIINNVSNIIFHRILNLKLSLLFNSFMQENVLLYGTFHINDHIIVTINKGTKETIFGYGNKNIMDAVFKSKLNFRKFKECDFMKNKLIQNIDSIPINNGKFIIYNIHENKKKKKKLNKNEINIRSSIKEDFNDKRSIKQEKTPINSEENENSNSESNEEDSNNISSNNNVKTLYNILEETNSQTSAITKSSGNSFWNINKGMARYDKNNFSSKGFLNLQILLGGLLLSLLILMIVLILQLKILQNAISLFYENLFSFHQTIRTFQQFTYAFFTVMCVAKDENGTCDRYISSLDTEDFNQTLFNLEQNEILSESFAVCVSKVLLNSETIKDSILYELLQGNITYHLINVKKYNNTFDISLSNIFTTFSETLLLLSNNMRIIVSKESKSKNRNMEPIYLLSGLEEPFDNIKNTNEDFSDYQIATYTYLINYRLYVQTFSSLSQRLYDIISEKNKKLINIFNIFHNIIFVVMIFQIITIIFYLITFNRILAQIINSVIIKFDLVFDNDNDFKKLFSVKIELLESIVCVYTNNPINYINDINKNCLKYKNLLSAKKKNEQRLNMNKKNIEEEDERIIFRDKQKYVHWIEIYKKGYDQFYIIFTIIIAIIDFIVYAIVFGIWSDYSMKSVATLELIYYAWNFERDTITIVNFYHTMTFNNQTLDDITRDYFDTSKYNCIERIQQMLFSYYELRQKRQKITGIYKTFGEFSDYNCKSLYDYIYSIKDNSFSMTLQIMEDKYNKNQELLINKFVEECENTQSFIGETVTPAFQSLYQKIIDNMLMLNNRTYEALIDTIFNSNLPLISSIFLNITRYIIYIVGKIVYTDAANKIIQIMGNTIIITLVLYICSECTLIIFFFFIYIWNMNNECKNMLKLKSVFEITNSNES